MKALLLGLSVLFAALPTGASPAPTVLKMEPWRRGVAIRVEVAGKERLFQVDTGGGVSFISPALAKELGCEKGARLVGFRMTGDKLDTPRCDDVPIAIGGQRFTIPAAGIYDTGELASKDAAHSVDGLIALDIFAGRTITFDFAGGKIVLETPASAARREAGSIELPARLGSELSGRSTDIFVDVPSAVGMLEFQLDSGNGGTILIGKSYAKLFGFDPDKGPQAGNFSIGKGLIAEGLIFPADITLDGNLGMPFLKNYLVTLDLKEGRVWLSPNPTPAPAGMGVPPTPPKS